MTNWKGFGKKRYYPGNLPEGNEENHPAEIQTDHLPNTCLEHYLLD
jgi:hypothetical protein